MIYAADDPFIYIPKPVVNNLTPETKFIVNAEGWVVLVINIVFIAVMSLGVDYCSKIHKQRNPYYDRQL